MIKLSKLKLFIYLILIFSAENIYAQDNSFYAVALTYTPVLNTSDFENVFGGENGDIVKIDNQGLIREMEFIAFPNTVFEVLEKIPKNDHNIYRIITSDYPYESSDLYIDSRFVEVLGSKPEEREKNMPDKKEILNNILELEGSQYMWGGNYGPGIEALLNYYRPSVDLPSEIKNDWCLKGVDCSGLVYQATNGATPRNTSSLIKYGTGLNIEGKTVEEITLMLEPLDLIAWNGHVIVVLDENTVIESTPVGGVHRSDLTQRLSSVMIERIPVNDWESTDGKRFVIRRWAE